MRVERWRRGVEERRGEERGGEGRRGEERGGDEGWGWSECRGEGVRNNGCGWRNVLFVSSSFSGIRRYKMTAGGLLTTNHYYELHKGRSTVYINQRHCLLCKCMLSTVYDVIQLCSIQAREYFKKNP